MSNLVPRVRNGSSTAIVTTPEADSVTVEHKPQHQTSQPPQLWQKVASGGAYSTDSLQRAATNRLIIFLASLPLCLAVFAFILHIRGEEDAFGNKEPSIPGWKGNKEEKSIDVMFAEKFRLEQQKQMAASSGFPHSFWKPGGQPNKLPKVMPKCCCYRMANPVLTKSEIASLVVL